jgi:hypothetical protein
LALAALALATYLLVAVQAAHLLLATLLQLCWLIMAVAVAAVELMVQVTEHRVLVRLQTVLDLAVDGLSKAATTLALLDTARALAATVVNIAALVVVVVVALVTITAGLGHLVLAVLVIVHGRLGVRLMA